MAGKSVASSAESNQGVSGVPACQTRFVGSRSAPVRAVTNGQVCDIKLSFRCYCYLQGCHKFQGPARVPDDGPTDQQPP